jgi:HNH endonuclease/Helix-turn-helix domain
VSRCSASEPRKFISMVEMSEKDKQRFKSYVSVTEGCWLWTGVKTPVTGRNGGYGYIKIKRKMLLAHRAAWMISFGDIPAGFFVCHRCDNKLCVRRDHLFLGTALENSRDMISKKRHSHGDRHWSRSKPERLARGDQNGARTKPETRARGEKVGRSKLTAELVLTIRKKHAEGETQQALGKLFGVHHGTIGRIVKRRLWRHVP